MGYHQLLVCHEGNFVVPLKVAPWWPTLQWLLNYNLQNRTNFNKITDFGCSKYLNLLKTLFQNLLLDSNTLKGIERFCGVLEKIDNVQMNKEQQRFTHDPGMLHRCFSATLESRTDFWMVFNI